MYGEMMKYYGLNKDLNKSDFFETKSHKDIVSSIITAIKSGGIIALTGIVGSGKTVTLRRIQKAIKEENKILFSKALTTDKRRVNIHGVFMNKIWYPLQISWQDKQTSKKTQKVLKKA